jgi:hypothetical protein
MNGSPTSGTSNTNADVTQPAPQWIIDAVKQDKINRMKMEKIRSEKKLTDDWRFWAAVIGT